MRWLSVIILCIGMAAARAATVEKPNIIFILVDDLGWGELGCQGQKLIRTPNVDRMAAEGLRFTQFYAGATVCAPSRSVLMTGLHTGHTRVRGNAGKGNPQAQMLRDVDETVAEALHAAGYATGLVGKWGLGQAGDEGHPNRQGFDSFFGFLDQTHAHNHFPDFLWRDAEKVPLRNSGEAVGTEGAGWATVRAQYAGDLFAEEALKFVSAHRGAPFFLYLSLTAPHANNERTRALGDGAEVPDPGPYAEENWTPQHKGHAAMITRMDAQIGRLFEELKKLQIDEKTLVIFTSDNGPHRESGNDPAFFRAAGPFRGLKRDLTEGGIRVPFIVRWPGRVPAGAVSGHVGYFGDFFATACELAGFDPPAGLDSISLVPAFTGRAKEQPKHAVLYWEFHEGGFAQAVLMDQRWKAIRGPKTGKKTQLFDLSSDPSEQNDLATTRPELVERAEGLFQSERRESADWPVRQPVK